MTLAPGTRLGPYEVTALIGQGGMGEVYRATDTHLKRGVAIKVLPASVAGDSDRLARFQREAEVLAALNHPNIAGIYGLEKSQDLTALVMELVEGDDLSQRIARGAIPVDEALPIARQIAEALEAAHEAGIMHRDLKPANIKVRADGTVKVLDFGLAKAMDTVPEGRHFSAADHANSPTITSPAMTQMGMILGTAAYMSPEQAKGRPVDRRTDIFAFGCVLYEMLTGRRAFDGDDVTEVLGAVVRLEPDWTRLPAACPPAVSRLLRLCLEKNLRNRRSSATDVRLDLEEAARAPQASASTARAPARRPLLPWAVAALLLVATIALAWPLFRAAPLPPVTRFQIATPNGTTVSAVNFAVSPNGKQLAYVLAGPSPLFIHSFETGESRPIAGTEDAQAPFWSPDSESVAFATNNNLKKADVNGGPVQTLCPVTQGATGTWNESGVIVFSSLTGLLRVSADGGTPTPLTTPDAARGETGHTTPHFLPDGKRFLFAVQANTREASGTYVGSLDATPPIQVLASSQKPQFAAPGQLVFSRNDALFSQSFDANTLRLSGEPTRLAESVARAGNILTGRAGFSVSQTGVLVIVAGREESVPLSLQWFDRAGQPLAQVGLANYLGFSVSPDGKRLAAHRHTGDADGGDVWITDLELQTDRRFTFAPAQDSSSPIWSPDGSTIAFSALRNGRWGIYRKPADGSGAEELLFESPTPKIPMTWSPDGTTIVFVNYDRAQADLWILPLSGDRTPVAYLQSPAYETHPQISPDGRWLSYSSNGVWVQSYPAPGTIYQVTATGGQARWRADGRELLVGSAGNSTVPGRISAIAVDTNGSALTFSAPKTLFDSGWTNRIHIAANSNAVSNHFSFAVSADGQRFLIPRSQAQARSGEAAPPMTVILNWRSLLGKK